MRTLDMNMFSLNTIFQENITVPNSLVLLISLFAFYHVARNRIYIYYANMLIRWEARWFALVGFIGIAGKPRGILIAIDKEGYFGFFSDKRIPEFRGEYNAPLPDGFIKELGFSSVNLHDVYHVTPRELAKDWYKHVQSVQFARKGRERVRSKKFMLQDPCGPLKCAEYLFTDNADLSVKPLPRNVKWDINQTDQALTLPSEQAAVYAGFFFTSTTDAILWRKVIEWLSPLRLCVRKSTFTVLARFQTWEKP